MVQIMLKEKREALLLTQKDVAEKIGVTERAYQNYEAGTRSPKIETILKIAQLMGSTVEELFKSV